MARVLISFLGTSDYKPVKYRFPMLEKNENGIETENFDDVSEENDIETDLFFTALKKRCKIDRIYLIGTIRSNWEKVFDDLFNASPNEQREQYNWDTTRISSEISEKTYFNTNYNAELDFPHKEKIEQLLGNDSKIILINYGITQAEIKSNSEKILGLDLSSKDEVYVDITHGFRSLPMSIMNTLIYLKYIKSVTIESIFYGLMDNESFEDYVPVVDLKSLIETSDWIMGAYAFKEFGKGYQIAEMLKEDKDIVNKIQDFSDVMNLNSMANIDTKTEALLSIRSKDINPFANQVLKPVISQFSTKNTEGKVINKFKGNNSMALLDLTVWHFKHKNFASSFLTILECMILYVCENCNFSTYILPRDKYLSTKRDKIDKQWDIVQHIKNSKRIPVYANKEEYIAELYDEYVNNQKDKCAKQVLGNEEINIIKVDDLDIYAKKIENYNDISLVYKSVNLIRNSIAHVNKYDSKSLIYKFTQLQEKLSGVSFIETNLIEIKILDASIKVLKKHMKF